MSDRTCKGLIIVLSLAGVLVVLYATAPLGVGIVPDSRNFDEAGSSLLAGRGYRIATGQPLAYWPPLFPVLIALPGLVHIDPYVAARWVNALAFGGTILVLGLMLRWCALPGVWAAAGAFLALTSASLLSSCSMAITEPLFLFLLILSAFLLARSLQCGSLSLLLGAGAAAAMAFLTRYPGLFFVGAWAVGILVLHRGRLGERLRRTALFVGVAALPGALWMFRNWLMTGSATGRTGIVFHPMPLGDYLEAVRDVIVPWFVPWVLPLKAAVLVLVVVAIALSFIFARTWQGLRPSRAEQPSKAAILWVLSGLSVAVYGAMALFSRTFLDAWMPMDFRTLSPIFLFGLVLLTCASAELWNRWARSRPLKTILACLVVFLAVANLCRGVQWVSEARANGIGLEGRAWRESETVGRARALPAGTLIFSNAPAALALVTGRPVIGIPQKIYPHTGRADPDYLSNIARMRQRLTDERGVYVHFNHPPGGPFPPLDEIRHLIPMECLCRCGDGAIYRPVHGAGP